MRALRTTRCLADRLPCCFPYRGDTYTASLQDDLSRRGDLYRHQARIREIAAGNIIEATACARMDRADRYNTRPAIERQEYKVGDLVDLWYEPLNKDKSGWRGPGKVHSLQPNEGVVTVRYQGRSLDRRAQEVRPHIPHLVFFSMRRHHHDHWKYVRCATEDLVTRTSKTYGLIWSTGTKVGWQFATTSLSEERRKLLQSGFKVAGLGLHCPSTITMRLGRGAISLQALTASTPVRLLSGSQSDTAETLQKHPSSSPVNRETLISPFLLMCELVKDLEDHSRKLEEYCIVQFPGIRSEDVEEVRQRFPDPPLMAGRGLRTTYLHKSLTFHRNRKR